VQWELDRLRQQYDAMTSGKWAPSPRQFYTGNASVARAAVLDTGGFNPAFRRAEDVELAYRLEERGYSFVFAPEAHGWHYAQRSFAAWKGIASAYGRADVMMDQAHPKVGILNARGDEFHLRAKALQLLARACLSRPMLLRGVVAASGVTAHLLSALPGRLGMRLSGFGYSVIFNLLFWEGMAEEIGHDAFWELVRRNPPPREGKNGAVPAVDGKRDPVTS
jgi:GT2 family glycosyltransferase